MVARFKPYLLLAFLSALSLSGYLLVSHFLCRIGFPLDDAWIHQTYARNLALNGEWAFVSGQPSAGSTSPLWSGLLALGHLLGLAPYGWTYLLGWATLAATGVVGMRAFMRLCPARSGSALWVGSFLVLEWHLVWAAGSGMETLFFALLVLLTLTYLIREAGNWLILGVLIGLSVWVRPDGITLLGPAFLTLFFSERTWKSRFLGTVKLGCGALLLVIPYLAFNYVLSGGLWPNTFFAKQAEYAVHRQLPLWRRILDQTILPLVGAGAVLAPGFVLFLHRSFRRRAWAILAGGAWLLGYFLLYALRLPVTYQHGRYVIPAMPVYFLWALAGMACWIQLSTPTLWKRVIDRAWLGSVALLLIAFWLLGARAYALDVAIIESEMVATAHWIADNTEPDSLVAAHDIGALGYFGGRQLLDLAGLVSPQVIHFIRDEIHLETFLNDQRADYLMTFPGWYPHLVDRGYLIFSTMGKVSPALGGENMAVYRWPAP